MFYHIFGFNLHMENLVPIIDLDTFYVKEFPVNCNKLTYKLIKKHKPEIMQEFANAMFGMKLRARYANTPNGLDGLYLVKSETELSRDDLKRLIDMKSEEGTLAEFVKESRFTS